MNCVLIQLKIAIEKVLASFPSLIVGDQTVEKCGFNM